MNFKLFSTYQSSIIITMLFIFQFNFHFCFFVSLYIKKKLYPRHRDFDGNISRSLITAIILLPMFYAINITHILSDNKYFTIYFILLWYQDSIISLISFVSNGTHVFKKKKKKRVSPLNAFPWVVIPIKRGQVEVQFDFDIYIHARIILFSFSRCIKFKWK